MNPRLMVCAFLIGCAARLALGQETTPNHTPTGDELKLERLNQSQSGQGVDRLTPLPIRRKQNGGQSIAKLQLGGTGLGKTADEDWLIKQNKGLLDIIKILYKDRDVDVKALEEVQTTMSLEDQIERRIALIKETLSEKTAK
jgi:hypothetical protein